MGPMAEVADRIKAAVAAGRRITVHGDYDVDGVCATAILVGALRELGADCDWYVPDRLGDGYGLTEGSVEAIAARGGAMLITVDCGIGSVAAGAPPPAAGPEGVVTHHPQPPSAHPPLPPPHPPPGGHPCRGPCGAGGPLALP